MFRWGKNKEKGETSPQRIEWNSDASAALDQALAQAPVPGLLKHRVKNELSQAAENAAWAAGHDKVTTEDMMNGFLAKLPGPIKSKVEEAMQKGPEGLKDLEDQLKKTPNNHL